MFDADYWQEIYQTLSKNKFRTFLTAFGVSWGIFMLVVMLGAGKGLQNAVEGRFAGMAHNAFYIWTERTSFSYKGYPKGRNFNFNNDDIEALRTSIPEIELMGPRNQLGGYRGGNNVTKGSKTGAYNVNGDFPQYRYIQGIQIEKGRFINDLDINDKRKIAVIGPRVYEVLFEPEDDPIGEYIHINGVYFMVVGQFDTRATGHQAERDAHTIFIPFTTFQNAFNYGNFVSWFAITAIPEVEAVVVEEKVLKLLAARHDIHPDDNRAFGHFNVGEKFKQVNGLFAGISFLSWFVGIFTLLAGVIGVSNIMLVIIKERTHELGIRRAIGATPNAIISQIVTESMVLTTLSGFGGLLLGR